MIPLAYLSPHKVKSSKPGAYPHYVDHAKDDGEGPMAIGGLQMTLWPRDLLCGWWHGQVPYLTNQRRPGASPPYFDHGESEYQDSMSKFKVLAEIQASHLAKNSKVQNRTSLFESGWWGRDPWDQ